jgi:ABC-2 type transport system permease protein
MLEEIFRGTWVIAYRELVRFAQERARIVSSFGTPLLFLLIFGAGFNRIVGNLTPGVDFVMFIFPGIIAMTVLMTSVFSGLSVVWDREFGFLKEVLVAPLSRVGIVLGKAVGGSTVAAIQACIMLVLAPLLGIKLTPLLVLQVIPVLIIISLSLSGLGILVASRMRSQQGFHVIVQLIVFPLIFLSGVFFPVNNVPVWLQIISKANPLTYGVDAIRQLFLGDNLAAANATINSNMPVIGVTVFGHTMSVIEEVIVIVVLGTILLLAATWSFNTQE